MPLFIMMIVICIFVALFAIQNANVVSLSFLFIEFEGSLALVTLTSFLCGALAVGCYVIILQTKQYLKDRKTKETLTKLEQEKKTLEELVTYLKEHQGNMPPPEPKPVKVKNPFIRK